MKKIDILIVQYKPIHLEPSSNLLKFKRVLKRYAYLKPNLIIFPEYALMDLCMDITTCLL